MIYECSGGIYDKKDACIEAGICVGDDADCCQFGDEDGCLDEEDNLECTWEPDNNIWTTSAYCDCEENIFDCEDDCGGDLLGLGKFECIGSGEVIPIECELDDWDCSAECESDDTKQNCSTECEDNGECSGEDGCEDILDSDECISLEDENDLICNWNSY